MRELPHGEAARRDRVIEASDDCLSVLVHHDPSLGNCYLIRQHCTSIATSMGRWTGVDGGGRVMRIEPTLCLRDGHPRAEPGCDSKELDEHSIEQRAQLL